ncbi:flagellar basal body-associated FliL family protein [Treponema vincentii]|uniref:flagellar basal body-associated FliL family protein n=1 Tax=Treponema vincentii TaxID=69710 RepID=UPI0039BF56C4
MNIRRPIRRFRKNWLRKKEALKKSILDWFSLESAYRLSSELPQDIKQTLMERINKQLVLGKIHNIYFEEFVILY